MATGNAIDPFIGCKFLESIMSRQKQVSIVSILSAMVAAKNLAKEGKISAKEITTELAESLQIPVADLETRYKRFAANDRYKARFEKFEASVGGVEFVTVGKQGRPGISDAELAQFDALLDD